MAEKPKIIKRLEKKIGEELMKIELKDIFRTTNGYASDERGNIIRIEFIPCEDIGYFILEGIHSFNPSGYNLLSNHQCIAAHVFKKFETFEFNP